MLKRADNAYQEKDYLQAYSLYRSAAETDSGAYRAVFRAGLCAGYLSNETNLRIDELIDGYVQARRILSAQRKKRQLNADFSEAEADRMLAELREFALGYLGGYGKLKSRVIFENRDEAVRYLDAMRNGVTLLLKVDEIVELNHEPWKQELLSAAIDACDRALKYDKLTYKDGMTEKDGKQTQVYGSYKADKEYRKTLAALRERAVNAHNNLPTILAQADRFTSEIESEQQVIDAYHEARKRFLTTISEERRENTRVNRYILLAAAALTVLFGALTWFLSWKWLFAAAAVWLLCAAVLRIRRKRFEDRNFSAALLAQRKAAKASRRALAKKKSARRRFRSQTMKH